MQVRSIDWLLPRCAWTGDWVHMLGRCPDEELKSWPFGYGMMLQPTEPHWPGHHSVFIEWIREETNTVKTQRRKPLTLQAKVKEGFVETVAFNLDLEAWVRVCLVNSVWGGKAVEGREGLRVFLGMTTKARRGALIFPSSSPPSTGCLQHTNYELALFLEEFTTEPLVLRLPHYSEMWQVPDRAEAWLWWGWGRGGCIYSNAMSINSL